MIITNENIVEIEKLNLTKEAKWQVDWHKKQNGTKSQEFKLND